MTTPRELARQINSLTQEDPVMTLTVDQLADFDVAFHDAADDLDRHLKGGAAAFDFRAINDYGQGKLIITRKSW